MLDKQNNCSYNKYKRLFGDGGAFMKDIKKTYMNKIWEQKEIIFIATLFIIMVFVLTTLLMNLNLVKAVQNSEESAKIKREKVVTTICVEKDSTLWDIATRYYTEEYQDLNDMIEEIKKSNGIEKDIIHEGAYLIIPHYINREIIPPY